MTGLKTNERPGTKCQVRYVRMSASKVRVVLDLIRGKHVTEASQILAFSERLAAKVIDKALRSAVANAGHNDDVPAEELYVSACYADEGASLNLPPPPARARAGRIRKQTCHITIVVSRYSDDQLDELRRRAEAKGVSRGGRAGAGDARADRRRRVAGSRAAAGDTATPATGTTVDDTVVEDAVVEDTVVDERVVEDTVVDDTVVEDAVVEDTVVDESVVEDTVVDESVVEDTVVEDTVVDESVVEDAVVEDTVVEDNEAGDAVADDTDSDDAVVEDAVAGAETTEETN
jgi:large subunit ribosomal protein L22